MQMYSSCLIEFNRKTRSNQITSFCTKLNFELSTPVSFKQ